MFYHLPPLTSSVASDSPEPSFSVTSDSPELSSSFTTDSSELSSSFTSDSPEQSRLSGLTEVSHSYNFQTLIHCHQVTYSSELFLQKSHVTSNYAQYMLQYYWQYSIPSHDVTYTYNNKIRPFSQKQIKFQGFAKWSAILPSSRGR